MFSLAGATIFEWIILIWVCISIPFYMIIIFLLIKYRKEEPFDGPFFKLCVSLGVADLNVILFGYPLLCFRIWGWIDFHPMFYHPTLSWWFRVLPYLWAWTGVPSQFNGVAILAFNRFRTIVQWQKEPWTTTQVRLAIFLQWVVAFVIASPYATQEYTVEEVNGTGGAILHSRPPKSFQMIYVMVIGFGYYFSVVISVGVLYTKMYLTIRRVNKTAAASVINAGNPGMQRAEIKLAFMGFMLFLLSFAYCFLFTSYAIMTKIGNPSLVHVNNIFLYQTGIVFSLINPYLLIACSKSTKEKFLEFVRWKENNLITVHPAVVKYSVHQNVYIQ